MRAFFLKNEKIKILLFYTVFSIIFTWPVFWHFFSSVPSSSPDIVRVVGVTGERLNILTDLGFFRGTFELLKHSGFNIITLYAYFELILGRIPGYNILFLLSFILSGFGGYLLAFYFTKNKSASLLAGMIFAFSPFHVHNSLSISIGAMHQEWLPFFALYLFRFFDDLSLKNFSFAGLFLILIGISEYQMLAFSVILILPFFVYKLIAAPKLFLRRKLWLYFAIALAILSVPFFFMSRSFFSAAGFGNNFLDAGIKPVLQYLNDSLNIFVPSVFHSNDISTVGSPFAYFLLGFSMLGAWGVSFLLAKFNSEQKKGSLSEDKSLKSTGKISKRAVFLGFNKRSLIMYFIIFFFIIIEYLPAPLKVNSLLHSSFYEKIGQDKEKYSLLEVPGNTDYGFASRDMVWRNIHRKNTINKYDFDRENQKNYTFQRGTPIIRTLLYDIPSGDNDNDRDIVKNSYYNISSEILNYYNIRYIILDKEGLKGDPEKGDLNMIYSAKAYISSVIKCADEYGDDYLYACKIDQSDTPEHMFLAMDYSNKHWVEMSKSKNGLQRWAENGAGMKLVNMTNQTQKSRLNFNLKIAKPLWIKVFLNDQEIFNKYITAIGQKQDISADLQNIKPGENEITFGVYGADNSEIYSGKKSDTARIYAVEVE